MRRSSVCVCVRACGGREAAERLNNMDGAFAKEDKVKQSQAEVKDGDD